MAAPRTTRGLLDELDELAERARQIRDELRRRFGAEHPATPEETPTLS